MTVIHMRPVGWGEMTPAQWGNLREMIRLVLVISLEHGNTPLGMRAQAFMRDTEGRDA